MSQGRFNVEPATALTLPAVCATDQNGLALATLANGKPAALAAVRLSATDAFFVAYQQRSGILMQLGGEVDLEGSLERPHLEQMVSYIVEQWPRLGQCLDKTWLGLKWAGSCHTEQMLRVGNNHNGALAEWRNKPIDPFREPPFQVLWIPAQRSGDPECGHASNTVAFRAHHSAMDGESFVAVTMEAAHFLSCASGGRPTPTPRPAAVTTLKDLVSAKQLLRRRRLAAMWGYTRWLAAEARAGQSTRLKVNAFATGDTHICERRLDCNVFVRLKQRATATRTAATWLCAAAWMRAIHAWNISHDATSNPNISLEFPVSLRHGQRRGRRDNQDLLGNYISPLVVVGDATRPLEQLARELRKQLIAGIRNQAHLGTPLITAPGKFLPWNLFQRVAVNPRTTGFATSHFTWFEQPDVCADIARLSGGALRVTGQRIYTPVCLHMGAALAVLASPNYAQIFLTYRETALSKASAERLVDLMLAELDGES